MVEHILNISMDIMDKMEAERRVEEKSRSLEQSNASLQEFDYIASHHSGPTSEPSVQQVAIGTGVQR